MEQNWTYGKQKYMNHGTKHVCKKEQTWREEKNQI
jgi:hypothetical protein